MSFFNTSKIFCISFQRSGTTSVGDFFVKNGYSVVKNKVSRENKWSYYWHSGDFEKIFKSRPFIKNKVFEDGPWFFPDFYKYLFHKFPNSKFILIKRNPNDWYKSMVSHSNGMNPGNSYVHSKIYRREKDLSELMSRQEKIYQFDEAKNLLDIRNMERHYIDIYNMHYDNVLNFFNTYSPNSLFVSELEDKDKWNKLADFFNIKIDDNFEIHSNKTNLK